MNGKGIFMFLVKQSQDKHSTATSEHEVKVAQQDNAQRSIEKHRPAHPYMQNRELSWLTFNERVLDQGADESVPLLERLQFVSIFWSNLQEFFMVRVGSLTDLMLLKKQVIDTKSNMTPEEQLQAIYARCHELYPLQERIYATIQKDLAKQGVKRLTFRDLNDDQRDFLIDHMHLNVLPFLSPQIINARHPFPHLENGALYIIVRLTEGSEKKKSEMTKEERAELKEARKKAKNLGAEGVTLGIIPLPAQCRRVIKLPGQGFRFILLEDALEAMVHEVYSMYHVKHSNIICVTRNADLDATEGADEREEDYREHMKRILKKRARLAPVRLESRRKLSATTSGFLLKRLHLEQHQVFTSAVPLDMGYAFALPGMLSKDMRAPLISTPFTPSWPACLERNRSITEQVQEHEVLLSYPYESMDPFIQLLREAAHDPEVVSIKITLYRLANQSHLAEAIIDAAESGKEVTALFELRARFDEKNNIIWSQRFEEAGANVIYGFHDYKVHSKICSITRRTPEGLQYITQLGTGNYNEKTARLYTDFSFITTDPAFGQDAMEFFHNMGLESTSRAYKTLWVAPLQIKQNIIAGIDKQIELARHHQPCGLFFKTNSITDKSIIKKISEASNAGVHITLLVRGISCILPHIANATENVRVVSIVGRLLEHSRIYGFGPTDTMELYLSSADLMTRNMDKRIEIAWPVKNPDLRAKVLDYVNTCLKDTAKLRDLLPDGTYTPLPNVGSKQTDDKPFNSQEYLIATAHQKSHQAHEQEMSAIDAAKREALTHRQQAIDDAIERHATSDLEEQYQEALQHNIPASEIEKNASVIVSEIPVDATASLSQSTSDHKARHAKPTVDTTVKASESDKAAAQPKIDAPKNVAETVKQSAASKQTAEPVKSAAAETVKQPATPKQTTTESIQPTTAPSKQKADAQTSASKKEQTQAANVPASTLEKKQGQTASVQTSASTREAQVSTAQKETASAQQVVPSKKAKMEHSSEQAKQQSTADKASAEKESTNATASDQQSEQPAISNQQPAQPSTSEAKTKQPSDIDWPAQPERPKPHHGFFWHLFHR
jgi:polyphosphate kinase